MPTLPRLMFALLLLTAVRPAAGQPLFGESGVLDVELAGPLGTLFADKHEPVREERAFTLATEGRELPIRVRIRGKSRVQLCTFPPLRLNFSGSDTADTAFDGQEKLKLVTHCRRSRYSQTDVLEEYAAYRIFNLLSDRSLRVRLLRIRYSDTAWW